MSNIVLTGFMGTGKSTVGREVARRLKRRFVDMDAEIEARSGKSVARIFAEDGEAAFRMMEAALCQELSAQQGLVIATGGGALLDAVNRGHMTRSGTVVCLSCDASAILQRLHTAPGPERPLLDVEDPAAELERLLTARHGAYQAMPWHLDTTRLSVPEAAGRVIDIARSIILSVHYPGGEYNIRLGGGLLAQVGDALRQLGVSERSPIAVVANPVVVSLYGSAVESSLRRVGYQPYVCSIPDGEQHKTLATVSSLYAQFLTGGLDRSGWVLSLGGGVAGDIAGFAAATFMRGLPFVQVPTTLLAMVDASVGGKTGVDLPQGKNLVGAFKQPAVVWIDPATLDTLPAAELNAGLVELIKHAIIGDAELFALLEQQSGRFPEWQTGAGTEWIARSLRVKIAVVEQDPFERGRRAVLNLGHTVGHALEQLSGFALRHGEAVSIGLVAAARIAVAEGIAAASLAQRIEALLCAWGLPVRCPPYDADAIYKAMAHDKKRQGHMLRWVLPVTIGEVTVVEGITPQVVKSVLHSMGSGSAE